MRQAPDMMMAARGLYMLQRAMREHLINRESFTDHVREATEYSEQAGVHRRIYCGSEHEERWIIWYQLHHAM